MKSQFKNLDEVQIIGFLLSAAVAVISWFTGGQNAVASGTLGFVMGGFTQLFDLQKRQMDTEERLLKANALGLQLQQDEWLLKELKQIVDSFQAVRHSWFDLFNTRAADAIVNCRDTLLTMSEGFLINQRLGQFEFGMEAFGKAKESIKATTAGDAKFWESDYGRRYFQKNVEALKRGVKVTRVFIQQKVALREIEGILREQFSAGISVYLATPQSLPIELAEDYLIMDDRVLSHIELTPDGQDRQERISINPSEVGRKVRNFRQLLNMGFDLKDEEKILDAIARMK